MILLKLLGPPSTKSSFDNDVWIYMERKISTGPLIKLSKKKIVTNNVLILSKNNDFSTSNLFDVPKIDIQNEVVSVLIQKIHMFKPDKKYETKN